MIFDGSTRQGEAIAVIVRFLDDNWSIIQRLVRIDICSKSVNDDDLAQVLNQCLSVDYGVKANSLLTAMRDGARIAFIFRITRSVPEVLVHPLLSVDSLDLNFINAFLLISLFLSTASFLQLC